MSIIEDTFPGTLQEKFSFYNYNHAVEILANSFPGELSDIKAALNSLTITKEDICRGGGNESPVPPKFNAVLTPKSWQEIRISGDLLVKMFPRSGERKGVFAKEASETRLIEGYIDGHNIDFIKGRIALDVEWNSKDQTFDRDLFAMRTYHECNIISLGIIVTRDEALNGIFKSLGLIAKYGASTTWMGKLLPRLNSRRHGGCPILAIGIKPACIVSGGSHDN